MGSSIVSAIKSPFKPMLAGLADFATQRYPVLASAKLDGVRALIINGRVMSRSLKPIPNRHVQDMFGKPVFDGMDGELICGNPMHKDTYRNTVSIVMSENKPADYVSLFLFDNFYYPNHMYTDRKKHMEYKNAARHGVDNVCCLRQHMVHNYKELMTLEEDMLNLGYEGLILRDPDSPYKFGRSTTKEGFLLKLKRFTDNEFKVIGFEERMHNENTAFTNELGRTAHSSHKENKSGRGDLGALILRYTDGTTFNCGSGFSDLERTHIWNNRKTFIGKKAKVKYFAIGMLDAPRHPVFLGWRVGQDT